ncbi:hypothetical protein [Dyadobacter sandarakinus]|uniref:DUF4369 domain-containing protein n=1 Tax=Dyadobacter sandarakinus TaxID=2747268 RepID=A0ABX7I4L7_9BACT|nr:hypothetical protein [Dyadobacter sandarakinus]QRR01031.1 hypothetical protein HWI92_09010 [Dyadobacter sandarakinus]
MTRTSVVVFLFVLFTRLAAAQAVTIRIKAPKKLNERKALLLTREKEFAAVVHSIQLGYDTTHLQMDRSLLPDLYQFQVSGLKGTLTFFFESGTEIRLDTGDVARSAVSHSKSNLDWVAYRDSIQRPADKRLRELVLEENLARKIGNLDSARAWVARQEASRIDMLNKTTAFIAAHPASYVSLYLLKNYWYALKTRGLFEQLDPAMAHHRTYRLLKEKNKAVARK